MPQDENSGTTATTLTRRELNLIVKLLRREYDRLGGKTAGGRLLRNLKKERYTREQVQKIRDLCQRTYKASSQGDTIMLGILVD